MPELTTITCSRCRATRQVEQTPCGAAILPRDWMRFNVAIRGDHDACSHQVVQSAACSATCGRALMLALVDQLFEPERPASRAGVH